MIDGTRLMGFLGMILVIIAYLPQIYHLIKERCSGGISIKAYCMWTVAALLILVHAVDIHDPIFIALQSYQLGACGIIVFFCRKYKDSVCETHRHHQPSWQQVSRRTSKLGNGSAERQAQKGKAPVEIRGFAD